MGGLICCMWRMFCCECTICEPTDDWNIANEARNGERGAGWLHKRGKNSAIWSKRFFVITDTKLIYYTEKDRTVNKGEIILAGATATPSTTRASSKNHYYFNISHPQCGVRELYAKTNNRREQWMEKINDISAVLTNCGAVYGKLFKQGGMSKNTWQERWCICSGKTLDYFDGPTDNQSKGSLDLINASITPVSAKDKKWCFELSAATPGKKGNKKYVFSVEKESDRDRWVEAIKRASVIRNLNPTPGAEDDSSNPIHPTAGNNLQRSDSECSEASRASDVNGAQAAGAGEPLVRKAFNGQKYKLVEMKGYLQKKSPALMKGWQKRYFKMQTNGEIAYYKSEEEANRGAEPKGVIDIRDILKDVGLQLSKAPCAEITIRSNNKKITSLKANSYSEAQDWADCISHWMEAMAKEP